MGKILKATHQGILKIGGFEIPAYNLPDGTRVLSRIEFIRALGRTGKAKGGRKYDDESQTPVFLTAKNLNRFITNDLLKDSKPIDFIDLNGNAAIGYRAELLPSVCYVFVDALEAKKIKGNQRHIAERAKLLIRGFAIVGIIALIDEATGYQDTRATDALAKILEDFLLTENKPYLGAFPTDFYRQIYRLNNWAWKESNKRPGVIGQWTNDIVYARLAPGILKELKARNPTIKPGRRKYKHLQFLTDKVGDPALKAHFDGILALQRASANWNNFYRLLERAYPKFNAQLKLGLPPEEIDEN